MLPTPVHHASSTAVLPSSQRRLIHLHDSCDHTVCVYVRLWWNASLVCTNHQHVVCVPLWSHPVWSSPLLWCFSCDAFCSPQNCTLYVHIRTPDTAQESRGGCKDPSHSTCIMKTGSVVSTKDRNEFVMHKNSEHIGCRHNCRSIVALGHSVTCYDTLLMSDRLNSHKLHKYPIKRKYC